MFHRKQATAFTSSLVMGFAALGCGGGSGGVAGGTGGGTGGGGGGSLFSGGSAASALAETFQVNVTTGAVTVVSPQGTLSGKAILKPGMFTGNSIGFNSSVLTNDALNTGIRSIMVSLTNNSDIPVGTDANGNALGLNVIFGGFVNTTGVVDQRPNTNVSTLAGSSSGFVDGPATSAKFFEPTGSAVGLDGSVYVSDFGNNRIRKISGGYVSTLAGTGTAADLDGGPTKAEFKGPYGLAVNPVDGSIIVADFSGNTIRRVTTLGVVNTVAGTGTVGSANGAGNVATFSGPTDVTVDSSGNIYVSEAGSNRIRKITLVGSPTISANYTVSTFAGNGTAGLVDGNGTSSEFNHPYGLTADTSGDLYVADNYNNVIRRIDTAGNVTTIAGTDVQSDLDGYGNAATFNHPFGVAYQNGALYVCEETGNRLREVMQVPGGGITATSWLVETLAGTGSVGDVNGTGNAATFNSPLYVAASPSSSLYVADFANNQIRRVNPSTGTFPIGAPSSSSSSPDKVSLSNGSGIVDNSDLGTASFINYASSLNPGQTSAAQPWNFVIPVGVTSFQFQVIVESSTTQLLALQSAIGVGSSLVDVRSYAGSFGSSNAFGYVNGNAAEARFGGGEAVAVDGLGNVFVADRINNAIRRIDSTGNVSTVAGIQGSSSVDVDGAGNVAELSQPTGLAVNSNGTEIFTADESGDTIREIELTPDSDATNPANWTVATIAGKSGTASDLDGYGNSATLDQPYGITLTPGGNLYVAETSGQIIRRLSFQGGSRSVAANWYVQAVAGQAGVSGFANGQGLTAMFNTPSGIASDGFGNIYICDSLNDRIRKMDASGNVTTLAGNGTVGYIDGAPASAEFEQPVGITVDSSGYSYVADLSDNVIRRVSPSGQVSTVAGTGAQGVINGPGNLAEFCLPVSVAVTTSGQLFVGSYYKNPSTKSRIKAPLSSSLTGDGSIRLIQTVVANSAGSARKK